MASVTHADEPLGFELFELLPDAIIAVDRHGVIRYANRHAGRMFGQAPATLISARVETLLPEHLRERHITHRIKYASQPRLRPMGTGLDLVAKRADGTTFPVDIMLNPLKHLVEPMVVAVVRDMTERRAAEETIRQSQARLAAIVTSSADAIIGKTLDGIVTSWNEAAERMFGYSAGEMIGQPIRRLIPADRQVEEDMILARLARSESIQHFETVRLAKNGRTFDASVTISPVRDTEGRIIGAAKIIHDISERKQAERALRLALDAAQLGWWQYDPIRNIVLWDARSKQMFDVAEDKTDIEEFKKRVHLDDLERVWAAVEAALDPTDPKPYVIEFRHRKEDGEVRWVEAHGLAHFEGAPLKRRAVSMVGTAQDITERKRHEEERRERAEWEHLLMREVNHRAKNILSVVLAMAHQTEASSCQEFIATFDERIQSLSASHDLLVKSEWRNIPLAELVRSQLAHFAALLDSRIIVRGPDLRITATTAQAISMAIHELATNAGKYGALSNDRGCVDIAWFVKRSEAGSDRFTMEWSESGGPTVVPPTQRGFGWSVLCELTKMTLGADVTLEYAPAGAVWHLECAADRVLQGEGRPPTSAETRST